MSGNLKSCRFCVIVHSWCHLVREDWWFQDLSFNTFCQYINWGRVKPIFNQISSDHVEARPCDGNRHWMGNLILEVVHLPLTQVHNCNIAITITFRLTIAISHKWGSQYHWLTISTMFQVHNCNHNLADSHSDILNHNITNSQLYPAHAHVRRTRRFWFDLIWLFPQFWINQLSSDHLYIKY